MRDRSKDSRSPHIELALALAINAGMRDTEIKTLKWSQLHLDKRFVEIGKSKTSAGDRRTIPINSVLHESILEHSAWYLKKFKEIQPELYVFPCLRPSKAVREMRQRTAYGFLSSVRMNVLNLDTFCSPMANI